jgi:hypothetical protein
MSGSADELILKMQHLEAQAKALREASRLRADLGRLKTAVQKLAWEAQAEVERLEKQRDEAEKQQGQLRSAAVQPAIAAAYVSARAQAEDADKQLIRARAKLRYALDQMSEVDRREYEAFQAEIRAHAHGQLAEDPLSNKG